MVLKIKKYKFLVYLQQFEGFGALKIYSMKINNSRDRLGGFIYMEPPNSNPKRYEIVKYSTWRMRLYQELQSISYENLQKKVNQTADKMFPHICQTSEQKEFYLDFLNEYTNTNQQDKISYFICLMLYSRDLKNHEIFIKMQKSILSLRLDRVRNGSTKMSILKDLIQNLGGISINQLSISKEQYLKNEMKITHWYDRSKLELINQNMYMKIPFQLGEAGLKKRKCFIQKGYVYADIQTSVEIVKNLYINHLKEKLMKIRIQTQKLLQNDLQNQIKPFMDKAINNINTSTIQETELNSEFKLNLKNIDAVSKKYFPPCMLHLNRKLKQNNHLKHQGRRQLWLFFKGCGMNVQDNKSYFNRYLSLKVSNTDLKNHMYNIEHAYGLVGKKQQERSKICRTIITGAEPKRDEYHGCPFRHWSKQMLAKFLHENYSIRQEDFKKIMEQKQNNSFQVACGRLFEANFKPDSGNLPQQITDELGKSPHQYFIAGMEATQWINTKTLRPTNKKPVAQNMDLQF